MNPEPVPRSICGPRRSCGKKSSKPGGTRRASPRCRCSELMNTTAGLTCSATVANASPRSAAGLMPVSGTRGGAVWARIVLASAVRTLRGRFNADANTRPNTNAIPTNEMNFNQSRVRTDIGGLRVYRKVRRSS